MGQGNKCQNPKIMGVVKVHLITYCHRLLSLLKLKDLAQGYKVYSIMALIFGNKD